VPAAQSTQLDIPNNWELFPVEQATQPTRPALAEYLPNSHKSQMVKPVLLLDLPIGHALQVDCCCWSVYLPSGQNEHSLLAMLAE
jgi:hypothetical protein